MEIPDSDDDGSVTSVSLATKGTDDDDHSGNPDLQALPADRKRADLLNLSRNAGRDNPLQS
jgi:hypothetical protein